MAPPPWIKGLDNFLFSRSVWILGLYCIWTWRKDQISEKVEFRVFSVFPSTAYYHQTCARAKDPSDRRAVSTKLHFFNFLLKLRWKRKRWKKTEENSFGCDRKNGFNVFALRLHFCLFAVPQSVWNSRWKSFRTEFELSISESSKCVHKKTAVSYCV